MKKVTGMKKIVKVCLLAVLMAGGNSYIWADEDVNVVKQSTICGRIVDASKQILPGASVYIEKIQAGVTSDVNGFYTFANLNPGTYTVKVTYVGYSPVELQIVVPEELRVTATTNDQVVMAVEHNTKRVFGVQFHPESIISNCGVDIIRHFIYDI